MKYCYIRFDDVCPTMDLELFLKAVSLMRKYNIKPLVGIIPDNKDNDQIIEKPFDGFWDLLRELSRDGWVFALHGYNHVYNQENPRTLLCGRKHSEFAGNSFGEQSEMIRKGKRILIQNGIVTDIFFAPAHTYDKTTLDALRENGFRINCDGSSPFSYYQRGILCIPCKNGGVPKKISHGINSVVCHTSEWNRPQKEIEYQKLVHFCEQHNDKIVSFDKIKQLKPHLFIFQKLLEKTYLIKNKVKSFAKQIIKR